jgi:large subunit ribosomal protein L3
MSKGILGKKLGMTGIFSQDGTYIPVTVVEVSACVVTQVKTEKTDGYNALQIGYGEKKASRVNKPLAGHFKKAGERLFATLREFPVDSPEEFSVGQEITMDMFAVGELVDVSGTSKGRGFAGTIKRHGFSRGPETHGCRNHREPGSIGCSAWPAKVFKGKKMPGHYGVDRKTVKNLQIVDIRPEDNVVLVKGAIPGPNTGMVEIRKVKTAS